MKAARDRREDVYDPERKDSILGRNTTRLEQWEEHLKRPDCGTGQSFEVRGEKVTRVTIGSRPFVELVFNGQWPRGLRHGSRDVEKALVGKGLAYLDPWDSVRLRTASTHWNVPGKYGPQGELFIFFSTKEVVVLSELVQFGPFISAETVEACAVIGLHMTAEENAVRSDRDSSPDLGEMWKYGCPKSPVWSDEGCEGE